MSMEMRRSMAMTGAAAVAAAAMLALIGGATATAAGVRQSGDELFTSTKPGSATGNTFHFAFTNPETPAQKPHTVTRIAVHYPAGTVFDSGAAPQCTATDAQLQVQGPSACPANSKVGSGLAVSDTGSSGGPFPRYTESTISQFNGHNEVIGVGVNKSIPAIKTVTHTKFNGTTASTDFPTFPGTPPPDPYTPLKSIKVDFPRRAHDGRATVRTPPSCPSVRYWTIVTDFTYADGLTQHVVSHSPCKPAGSGKHHHHKKHRHPPCGDLDEKGDCD
jgi:hypothetical protein